MGAATEPALVNRKAVWLGFRFNLIPFNFASDLLFVLATIQFERSEVGNFRPQGALQPFISK